MNKTFLLLLFLFVNQAWPQEIHKTKWGLGFGGIYPRFFAVTGNGYSENKNIGGYAAIQYSFNEYVSLRTTGNFVQMESVYYQLGKPEKQKINQYSVNLDVTYLFIPCFSVSPYALLGIGATTFASDNPKNPELSDRHYGYQGNIGFGVDWQISADWSLLTEVTYVTSSNNKIDGNYSVNEDKGLFGGNGDTYMTAAVGFRWNFGQGDTSDLCIDCPSGITNNNYYYSLNIKDPRKPEKDTVYLKDTVYIKADMSIHFRFDKSLVDLEQMPHLDKSINYLKSHPKLTVNLYGGTDAIGSNNYNLKLSHERVMAVYNYLVENGIAKERIQLNWAGEENPWKDNSSAKGRAYNRYVILILEDPKTKK